MVRALLVHWRLKLLLSLAFNAFFWSGYELLGRYAFFPLQAVLLTWFDRIIPFQPAFWGWIYLSQFSFTNLLPWFLTTRDEVIRCTTGLAVMTLISFAIFLVFPIPPPIRPSGSGGHLSMAIIAAYDGSFTCLPSLHAAFLCYMAALAWRLFAKLMPLLGWALCALWATGILYATLATRQHYALDLVAGVAVGGFSYWLAWRGSDKARATMFWSNPVAPQEGSR
ncbi:hypothetical protein BH09VER1_BH09VER1_22580 [soil metagenome]